MNLPTYLYGEYENHQYYNEELAQALRAGLSDNGFTISAQPTTNIDPATPGAIGNSSFVPVMPAGTLIFDTTIMKLKVITIAAIPAGQPGGPANATIETITSA